MTYRWDLPLNPPPTPPQETLKNSSPPSSAKTTQEMWLYILFALPIFINSLPILRCVYDQTTTITGKKAGNSSSSASPHLISQTTTTERLSVTSSQTGFRNLIIDEKLINFVSLLVLVFVLLLLLLLLRPLQLCLFWCPSGDTDNCSLVPIFWHFSDFAFRQQGLSLINKLDLRRAQEAWIRAMKHLHICCVLIKLFSSIYVSACLPFC